MNTFTTPGLCYFSFQHLNSILILLVNYLEATLMCSSPHSHAHACAHTSGLCTHTDLPQPSSFCFSSPFSSSLAACFINPPKNATSVLDFVNPHSIFPTAGGPRVEEAHCKCCGVSKESQQSMPFAANRGEFTSL